MTLTLLQQLQQAPDLLNDHVAIVGWYQHIRTYSTAFDWAVIPLTAEPHTVVFDAGHSEDEQVLTQSFDGTVLFVGAHAVLAVDRRGELCATTWNGMARFLTRLGLEVVTPRTVTGGRISQLSMAVGDAALVFPESLRLLGSIGDKGRCGVARIGRAGVATAPAPVSSEETEEVTPAHVEEPVGVIEAIEDVPPVTEATGKSRPRAIITGGFRSSHSAYIPDIEMLGYEMVTPAPEPEQLAAANISLVVYPMKARKTQVVEAAEARGIKTMTATELSEAVRSHRIRKGN